MGRTHSSRRARKLTRLGARTQARNKGHRYHRCAGVQRLEVLVAVMLARERQILGEDGSCTELAVALATLPSGVFAIVADAVAARGHADA
jgi:hypothetical protein